MTGGTQYTVNGNITGGNAPFTYQWSVKTTIANGQIGGDNVILPVIGSGGTTHTVTINDPTGTDIVNGLLCCKITDSKSLVTYAYYYVWLQTNPV